MFAIFDHLTSIVAGIVLLGALLVLQTRDGLARAQATLADASQARSQTLLDVATRDADNLLPRAQWDALTGLPYPTRLVRTGASTTEATFATLVQDAPGGPSAPAAVRYTLAPTGASVTVDGHTVALHTLRRHVDRGSGFDAGLTLTTTAADFSVAFGRAAGADVRDGAVPDGVSSVTIALDVAPYASGHHARDQRETRRTLVSHAEATVRPQNLGPAR